MGKATDFLKIASLAFVGVWIINHSLAAIGQTSLQA
jgi:hypothetical protein